MNIIPKDFTLHGLLNNPNEQFQIPSYQRRYAWKFNQQAALFKDIDMLMPTDGHLFGMLILHTGLYHGGLNTVQIVDGQQRLTTISILLYVLKRKFDELKDEYNASQISQLLYCGNPKESSTAKLLLSDLDNPDYQNLLKGKIEKIRNKRILEAYTTFETFISESFEKGGVDWLNGFFKKLIYTAKIIRLDVQQAQDAYKLFETINNRGLRLSATDVLKNFILGHAAKISEDKLDSAKELWADLITALDGIPTDDFFRQYVTSIYTRKITYSTLIQDFKKFYFKNVNDVDKLGEYRYNYGVDEADELYNEDEESDEIDNNSEDGSELPKKEEEIENEESNNRINLEDFLLSIVNAAKCYSNIWFRKFKDKKLNEAIADLQAIKSFPSYIFLMHYLQTEKDEKEKYSVLEMIGTLMLRRHVCSRRTAENDDIFANLLRIDFNSENYNEFIMNQFLEDYPEDDEFLDRFPVHELKPRVHERARYILSKINNYVTGDTGELKINSPEDVHIEHIIPQKITTKKSKTEFGDWEEYLGDKAKLYHKQKVNRIGNLTLLAGKLNISAYNNPFAKKKKSYRESNIAITKELANQNDFKFFHLDKRGQQLAKKAVLIWKF